MEEVPRNWTDMLNYWVTDNQKIQIENSINSSGIIHYSDETFLTDEVIDVPRSKLITRSKRDKPSRWCVYYEDDTGDVVTVTNP